MIYTVYAETAGLTPVIDRYHMVSDDSEITPVPVVTDAGRGFYSLDTTVTDPVDVRIDFGSSNKKSVVITPAGISQWSVFDVTPADCVISKITKNLVDTFNGKIITYNSRQNLIAAEQQRSLYDPSGRNPFVEICGPWPQTTSRGNLSNECDLQYHVEFHENSINDRPPNPPITETTRNIAAELIKIVMSDIRRGGNAIMTTWEDPGFYFAGSSESPELVIYLDITVKTFVNTNNPYLIGA